MWQYNYSPYLAHHGVVGQKWGKRNGPPYPLDSDGKAALRSQRKAEKESERKQRKTDRANALKEKAATKQKEKAENQILTKKQKKILLAGAAAVTGAVLLYRRRNKKNASEYEKSFELFKKKNDLDSVSASRLQSRIERLKMQKEIYNLSMSDRDVKRGKDAIEGFLGFTKSDAGKVGKDVITKVGTSALTGIGLYGLKALVSGEFDKKQFGEAIFNGGPKKK